MRETLEQLETGTFAFLDRVSHIKI